MFYPCKEFRFGNPDHYRQPRSDMGSSNTLICHTQDLGSESPSESDIQTQDVSGQTQRVRRGNALTADAKRKIKSAAYLLDKQFGKKCVAFITLTIPGLNEQALHQVASRFDEITRQFCQELTRLLERKHLSKEYLCVTEIQEKRWKNRGEVAPHLHIVCQGRRNPKGEWSIKPVEIRKVWEGILSNFLEYEIDCPAATRIESIKKSVTRYLGKYMSKGGQVLKEVIDAGLRDTLPPTWYRMANSLRKKVLDAIIHPSNEVKRYIMENAEELKKQGILNWYYPIYFDCSSYGYFYSDGSPVMKLVGCCGEFSSEEWMHSFSAMIASNH